LLSAPPDQADDDEDERQDGKEPSLMMLPGERMPGHNPAVLVRLAKPYPNLACKGQEIADKLLWRLVTAVSILG
jgi:hypothetical protein